MSNITKVHNYLNNGRYREEINIKSTKFKGVENKKNITNGKQFNDYYNNRVLKKNNLLTNKNVDKKNFFTWVVDALNPINHIPIINSINKLVGEKKKSLDILQSALGGAIYAGGITGLAKGIGGWFMGKVLPKNIVAANFKSDNSKKLIVANNGRSGKNFSHEMHKKVSYQNTKFPNKESEKKDINEFEANILNKDKKIDVIHIKKKNKNYFDFYSNNKKIISKSIDTKA